MTDSTAEQPPEKTSRRSRAEAVDEGAAPEPPKLRRRPMLIAVSVLLTAIGALLGAWILTGLSGTESYVAVREDIERGAQIKESDLVRTQLSKDAAVTPLLWDEQQLIVGQYASVDMAAGSVVTRDSVQRENLPPANMEVVGLSLTPGQTITGDLKTGAPVRIVLVPANTDVDTQPEQVNGTVARSKMSKDGTTKLVDVYVPTKDSPAVTAAAARQEATVVLKPSDSGDDGDDDGLDEPDSSPSSDTSDN